jgi:NAD(P)-dependent dehydrogenase (short-subunit alcohol dehydrogenase family)
MAQTWASDAIPAQHGRRFFITGANSGIGYQAALELARHGATVLLACRDRIRGEAALARLRNEANGPDSAADRAEFVLLDLASLESVRSVAEAFLARGLALDGLINNAGVFAPPQRRLTTDGFEVQWGTNVLGHFALTSRLLPALVRGGERGTEKARVVTVASIAHKRGQLHFENLNWEHSYAPMLAYQQSKLGDLMFALELERRLQTCNLPVESLAVHPGVAQSSLFKIGNSQGLAGAAERLFGKSIGLLLNDDAEGAVPTLFAATAPAAQGGAYYGPQGLLEMRGGDVGPAQIAPQARDEAACRRLWETCEESTGCSLMS